MVLYKPERQNLKKKRKKIRNPLELAIIRYIRHRREKALPGRRAGNECPVSQTVRPHVDVAFHHTLRLKISSLITIPGFAVYSLLTRFNSCHHKNALELTRLSNNERNIALYYFYQLILTPI